MGVVNFFTPVSYDKFQQKTWLQTLEETNDGYFSFGRTTAYVIPETTDLVKIKKTNPNHYQTISNALKIASYLTLVFPLLALTLKAVFRTIHHYQIKKAEIKPYDGPDHLSLLVVDTQIHILSYLKARSLANLSQTSTHFHSLILVKECQRKLAVKELVLEGGNEFDEEIVECLLDCGYLEEVKKIVEKIPTKTKEISFLLDIARCLARYQLTDYAESFLHSIQIEPDTLGDIFKQSKAEIFLLMGKLDCVFALMDELTEENVRDELRGAIVDHFLSKDDFISAFTMKDQIHDAIFKAEVEEKLVKYNQKQQQIKIKKEKKAAKKIAKKEIKQLTLEGKFYEALVLCSKISDTYSTDRMRRKIKQKELESQIADGTYAVNTFTDRFGIREQLDLAHSLLFIDTDRVKILLNEVKVLIQREVDIDSKISFLFELAEIQKMVDDPDFNQTLEEIKQSIFLSSYRYVISHNVKKLEKWLSTSEKETLMQQFKEYLRSCEIGIIKNVLDMQLEINDIEGVYFTIEEVQRQLVEKQQERGHISSWDFWNLWQLYIKLYKALPDEEKTQLFASLNIDLQVGLLIKLGKENISYLAQARQTIRDITDPLSRKTLLIALTKTLFGLPVT